MIRITDVEVNHGNIKLKCCHGYVLLRTWSATMNALGHTGINFFETTKDTEYLRDMLIGRLARVSKEDCFQTTEYYSVLVKKKLFSYKFLKEKKKEKKNGGSY